MVERHEFPEDNFFFWQLMLKEWLYDPKQTFLVVVLDAADLSNDEKAKEVLDTIISYAVWGSIGESKGGQATQAGEEYMAEFVRQCVLSILTTASASDLVMNRDARQSRGLVHITQI